MYCSLHKCNALIVSTLHQHDTSPPPRQDVSACDAHRACLNVVRSRRPASVVRPVRHTPTYPYRARPYDHVPPTSASLIHPRTCSPPLPGHLRSTFNVQPQRTPFRHTWLCSPNVATTTLRSFASPYTALPVYVCFHTTHHPLVRPHLTGSSHSILIQPQPRPSTCLAAVRQTTQTTTCHNIVVSPFTSTCL